MGVSSIPIIGRVLFFRKSIEYRNAKRYSDFINSDGFSLTIYFVKLPVTARRKYLNTCCKAQSISSKYHEILTLRS